MGSNIRVRFAPSPTGYLHVGGARTALFNYLFARHNQGQFILRIEDTDQSRYHPGALNEIFTSLNWLGITWDEGPEKGGEYGPYFQSQRTDLYKQITDQLIKSGHAYRCFCTAERLQKMREEQQQNKQSHFTGYDRCCRDLSDDEISNNLNKGKSFVVRLKMPLHEQVIFTDAIRGEITYNSDTLDDMVLMKSDGFPTYHLANVVDDHYMKITHILRGDEWIASTPRHILIYAALGWQPPVFAHMPVILSPRGGKLSKREGAVSVMDYKKEGYLPEALFNFLTLLGWAPGNDQEKMTREEIIAAFTLDRVSPKSAVLDEKKLEWMNGLYMQEKPVDALLDEVVNRWKEKDYISQDDNSTDPYYRTIISLLKDRSKRISDLVNNASYFFNDPETYEAKASRKHWKTNTGEIITDLIDQLEKLDDFDHLALEKVYREYAETTGLSGGKLIHPSRLAVSGVSFGPGLFELLAALGKERVIRRMKKAIIALQKNA